MINDNQVELISHAIGLRGRTQRPYRNYYNTGDHQNESWDDLVSKGMAIHKARGEQMGGNYYHVTDKGLEFILNNRQLFKLDSRIRKFKTLEKLCNPK